MIASWMLYAALVGILMTVAAAALDRAAVARQRPTRMIWAATLALSIAWPVGRGIARMTPERVRPVRLMPFAITVQSPAMTSHASALSRAAIDRALLLAWCGLSALLILRLVRGLVTLRRTSTTWTPAEIDGTRVRLSSNVGPALVDLHRSEADERRRSCCPNGFCRSINRYAPSCCGMKRSIVAPAIRTSCSARHSPSP